MVNMNKFTVVFLLILTLQYSYEFVVGYVQEDDGSQLVAVTVLYRDGDKTPSSSYPNDPYFDLSYWPMGFGQLTDVSKSNSREVTLTDVEKETSGEFKCEVSADAPLFHTDIRSAHLLVADIPEDGPVLRSEVQKVAPGAKIKANCTTPGSYPSMNITWFLNDVKIHSGYRVQIHNLMFHYDALPGKETVRSTISVRATPDLFKNGKMKLRCLATMFSLYNMSKETEIQEDAPQLALIMVPTTHTNEGMSNALTNFQSDLLMTIFLFFVHLHAWLRRITYH